MEKPEGLSPGLESGTCERVLHTLFFLTAPNPAEAGIKVSILRTRKVRLQVLNLTPNTKEQRGRHLDLTPELSHRPQRAPGGGKRPSCPVCGCRALIVTRGPGHPWVKVCQLRTLQHEKMRNWKLPHAVGTPEGSYNFRIPPCPAPSCPDPPGLPGEGRGDPSRARKADRAENSLSHAPGLGRDDFSSLWSLSPPCPPVKARLGGRPPPTPAAGLGHMAHTGLHVWTKRSHLRLGITHQGLLVGLTASSLWPHAKGSCPDVLV